MMISTGRPSIPPLGLTASPPMSMAACSILPAGAPAPVSARLIPTLIGLPLWAETLEDQHRPASSTAADAPSALLVTFIIVSSLAATLGPAYFFRASAYG